MSESTCSLFNMKLAIFGEILIDVVLAQGDEDHKMRLGGVVHAALAAWTLEQEYEVYYYAPIYLENEIQRYFELHGCSRALRIGDTEFAPGIILIGEPKEIGDQKYSVLMRDTASYSNCDFNITIGVDNVLVFPGGYNLNYILSILSTISKDVQIHIDIANGISGIDDLNSLGSIGRRFETIFNSTSHHVTAEPGDSTGILKEICLNSYCLNYVSKENRGGGRRFQIDGEVVSYPAFLREIAHSVGVGDSFDVAYIFFNKKEPSKSLRRASLISAEYASTSFPDDLKRAVGNVLSRIENYDSLDGVVLPWDDRPNYRIYVAAPDFDWLDTSEIRRLEKALSYHNFTPLLPIKINGQLDDLTNLGKVSTAFEKDIELIEKSSLLIVVLLNEDPGTLVELGYAAGLGKPVLVYDPYKLARNPMVTQMPKLVSDSLEIIINEVFLLARR